MTFSGHHAKKESFDFEYSEVQSYHTNFVFADNFRVRFTNVIMTSLGGRDRL